MDTMEQVKELLKKLVKYELREDVGMERSDKKKPYSLIYYDENGNDGEAVFAEPIESVLNFLIEKDISDNNGWTDTAKRQPEHDQQVLFIFCGQIMLGRFDILFDIDNTPILTFNTENYITDVKDVKYWQPLPKMPN